MSSVQEYEKVSLLIETEQTKSTQWTNKHVTVIIDPKYVSNPTTSIFGTTRFFKFRLLSVWFCTQHHHFISTVTLILFWSIITLINLVVTFRDECYWAFPISPNKYFRDPILLLVKSKLFDIDNLKSKSELRSLK